MALRSRAILNNLNDRAREVGIFDQVLTLDDLAAVRAFYDFTCLKCGAKPAISIDHVKPLSKGGENTRENLQLLCVDCNKVKRDSEEDYRKGRIVPNDYMPANPANRDKAGNKAKANKTTWKPGQSGNPAGAPKRGMSWAELIKAEGEKYNEALGMTRKEYLVMCAFDHAEKGNAAILKELFQRSEPLAQLLDVEVNDKRPSTPEERSARFAELLERARARRAGLVA